MTSNQYLNITVNNTQAVGVECLAQSLVSESVIRRDISIPGNVKVIMKKRNCSDNTLLQCVPRMT